MQTNSIARLKPLLPSIGMVAVLALPLPASAAPGGFDLDLKELKKPADTVVKPRPHAAERKKAKTHRTHPKGAKRKLHSTQPAAPRSVTLEGATACTLARQFLEALAEPVPVEKVLQGITMPAASMAARYQGATVLLACGLHAAEAYTFQRLLEADGVQLINIADDETPLQVMQSVARQAGLSYRQLQGTPLRYELTDAQGRLVHLTVGNETAGGKQ